VIDSQDIREATAALPERVFDAAQAARGLAGLPSRESIEHVVVLGMGGSGVAGDILLAAAAPFMAVPVVVVKGYELPHFVGEGSLVFVVSFSGDTEETIETGTEAALQGARIVAVTGGGEIAKRAAGWGAPVVSVPSNIPQPRVGLGALAIPPLVVLEEIGLFPGASQWIDLAVDQLRRRRDALMAEENEAAALARRIGRTFPVIYGGGALGAAAAARWKTQINENAKAPAFWNTHPELCHNELSQWGQHGDVTRQVLTLVNLRHDHEHPQVSRRFELATELIRETVAAVEEVRAQGEGELAQLLDLILFGDFVALHLALQEGVDPGPIPAQEELKAALSAG
jgi:glucose/mannose-6-phosphate isomerase